MTSERIHRSLTLDQVDDFDMKIRYARAISIMLVNTTHIDTKVVNTMGCLQWDLIDDAIAIISPAKEET